VEERLAHFQVQGCARKANSELQPPYETPVTAYCRWTCRARRDLYTARKTVLYRRRQTRTRLHLSRHEDNSMHGEKTTAFIETWYNGHNIMGSATVLTLYRAKNR